MLSLIKFLKIVLPVATVTSATIATVSLVSFQKLDNKLNKETEDRVLEDFERPSEKFEEQKMLYAKDGQGKNVAVKDEKQKQHLLEEFEKNNGRLEQSDQAFDELKDKGSNHPSKDSQIKDSDIGVSKTPDLKSELSDVDQLNTEDQAGLYSSSKKSDELVSSEGPKDIISQKSKENTDLNSSESKKENDAEPQKTAEVKEYEDTSKSLVSSEEGSGEENCESCPNGKKSKEPVNEENKGLDMQAEEDKGEISRPTDTGPEANKGNYDVPDQTSDGTSSISDPNNNKERDSDGILNEETSNSPLTSPEQLDVLNNLYGQVTDVLSQLNSRFNL